MLETEEALFDEYKSVDNFCRDMFSVQSGVNQYLAEMEQAAFRGRAMVPSWQEDYRQLKHVRWLRNQIAHEPGATNCTWADVGWLEEFHDRLLASQDPLALLAKAEQPPLRPASVRERERQVSAARPSQRPPVWYGETRPTTPYPRTGEHRPPQKGKGTPAQRRIVQILTAFIGVATVLLCLGILLLFLRSGGMLPM